MSTTPLWQDMTPRMFDTDATDTQLGLFAAGSSGELADLFSTEPDPAVLPAGTRVRLPKRRHALATIVPDGDPVGAWFRRANPGARPTVSVKFDGAGYASVYPEDVEVIAPADDSRRPAVRRTLEARYGLAIPVTEAMVDAVLAEMDAER